VSIAQEVAAKAGSYDVVASTLAGGYAVKSDGTRSLFPPGTEVGETKRNAKGRCTRALYGYGDGSAILFTYNEITGASFKPLDKLPEPKHTKERGR